MKLISIDEDVERVYVSAKHIEFKSQEECLKFMNNFKLLLENWHPEKTILLIEDDIEEIKCQ